MRGGLDAFFAEFRGPSLLRALLSVDFAPVFPTSTLGLTELAVWPRRSVPSPIFIYLLLTAELLRGGFKKPE